MNQAMNTIDPANLNDRLQSNSPPLILDPLPEEHFESRHLPGALNACVYEIEFINKMEGLVPDKSAEIVVYGESDQFEAATLAANLLAGNGWSRVSALQGGLEAWIDRGFAIEGDGASRESLNGAYEADPGKCHVRWIGRNLLNQHNGTVALQSARIELDDGRLAGGEAVLDMTAIVCEDIEDPNLAQVLIAHLGTGDFFLVDSFPTARFVLTNAAPIANARPGSPNYHVEGEFTLRGQTETLSFEALLGSNDESLALQAQFDFDRVRWNSKYGSGKIYEALGQHIVNDLISISFQLVAPLK